MSEVLVVLDDIKSLKKVSAYSSDLPDKLRLTTATLLSLSKNIRNGKIPESVTRYNQVYNEKREAIQEEAARKAESEVQSSIGISEANRISEEDAIVLALSTDAVVFDKSENLGIEIGSLSTDISSKLKASKGYLPKPLRIEPVQLKLYSRIGKKVRKVQREATIELQKVVDKTPGWKKLFPENETINVTRLFIEEAKKKKSTQLDVEPTLSMEELQYKRMIGKIYDELSDIRKRMKRTTGFESPFERGLEEREQYLVKMLSDVTGVDFPQYEVENVMDYEKSELQKILEEVVGYIEPKTEEQRIAKERELQEYYSNPDVSETIDRLRHKDILFSYNEPEAQKKISEAEQRHNEELAEQKLLESMKTTGVSFGQLVEGAQKQAQILFDEGQYEDFIKKGAVEQAEMLKKLDDFMEKKYHEEIIKGGEEQAQSIHNHEMLIKGSVEQAEQLHDMNTDLELQEAGEIEAQRIVAETDSEKKMLIESAKEEAVLINDNNKLIDGSLEQAEELNTKNLIIDGALEEAERIIEEKDNILLRDGALEQAEELNTKNQLIDGAEEQAILLNYSKSLLEGNEQLVNQIVFSRASDQDVVKGAEEQAQMLVEKNQRIVIEAGAEEEARKLYETSKLATGVSTKIEETELNCSYPLVVGDPKPIKLGKNTQYKNLLKRTEKSRTASKPSYKEVLKSIKEELSGDTLEFLQLSEDIGRRRAA